MIVEIIKTIPDTWFFNKKGWRYEVEKGAFAEVSCYLVTETKNNFWQLFLPKDCVKVIEE